MFYDRFYEMCQQKGVTPAKVADALKINKSTVYMWKKQKTTPKYDTVQKLADYFGIDVNWLMNGQTLEQRDQAMKDHVARRFKEVQSQIDNPILEENAIFNIGDSFYGGKVKVTDVIQHDDETATVTFSIQKEGIQVADLKKILDMCNENGITTSGLVELIEVASRVSLNRRQTAPQPPAAPTEGTDTTPPPDGSEGPKKGE